MQIRIAHPTHDDLRHFIDTQLYEVTWQRSMTLALYLAMLEGRNDGCHIFALGIKAEQIVGICIVEQVPLREHQLTLLKSTWGREALRVHARLDKSFFMDGFMHVFVRPEYRRRGYASQLMRAAEWEYVQSRRHVLGSQRLPMLAALGRCYDIAETRLRYCYQLRDFRPYGNLPKDIHEQTQYYLNQVLDKTKRRAFVHEAHRHFVLDIPPQPRRIMA